ncbi:SNF2-related protein [Streptomyces kronopolitis]|uniref:SNF2-related protein n=1 Tax=Streptomyces kronopolitis TaxID=1612435 RepID=UPI00343A5609
MSIDRLQPVLAPAAAARTPGQAAIPPSRSAEPTHGTPLGAMSTDAFRRVLQRAISGAFSPVDAVAAEAGRRLARGRLDVPDLRMLLLDTSDTDPWSTLRRSALSAVAASPALAPSIISMHAQVLRQPSATVRERHDTGHPLNFLAQATLTIDQKTVTGSAQRSRTRKTARQQAMTTLIAALAELPDPLTETAAPWPDGPGPEALSQAPAAVVEPAQGRSPLSVINEFAQAGHCAKPVFRVSGADSSFTATVTALHRGQPLEATGEGTSKQGARTAAAERLLELLQQALAADLAPPTEPRAPELPVAPTLSEASFPATGLPRTKEAPPAPPATAGELFRAQGVLRHLLAEGAALTLLPSRHPARTAWLFYRPDGAPLAEAEKPVAPLQALTRDLVLAEPGGIMPRRATTIGLAAPLGLTLPILLTPHDGEHASVTSWRHALRLALHCVAQQRVHPALTAAGEDCWRVGPVTETLRDVVTAAAAQLAPEGHCLLAGTTPVRVGAPETAVWNLLDAVADTMLRTPGAATVVGPGPYSGPAHPDSRPQLWKWADAIEDSIDPHPTPGLILRIKQPDTGTGAPHAPATLHLATGPDDSEGSVSAISVWNGQSPHPGLTPALLPGVRRALRRAARICPPLEALATQDLPNGITLSAKDLAELHRGAAAPLEELGITLSWPAHLTGALSATAVLGTHDDLDAPQPGSGLLALERLVDCRWHINLDGAPLTDDEMTTLAEAAWPLIQLRGRWLLIDPDTQQRARARALPPLPSLDALTAALSGSLTLNGEALDARPAGALAALVDALRQAPETPQPVAPPASLTATLRHYQERALSWLTHTLGLGFGALLADDMGLGKTLTTIALHLHRAETTAPGPTLVVCPASLVTNWHREITRFAPDTTVVRYHGADRALATDRLDHHTIVITTYGTARRDTPALAAVKWGLVVADEAQHIKNPAAATAKALRELPTHARLAVTGTPAENNLTELWAILDWTNPHLFGTRTAFRARYAAVEKDPASPAAARLTRLIGPFMLRRRKSDPGIAPELPGKVHHHRIVALTDEQTGLYEATVRATLDEISVSTGFERRGLVLKLLQSLRRICNTPALYLKEPLGGADPGDLALRSGKLSALDELLPTLADRGEAALIFTGYVQMGRILEHHLNARGRSTYFLHGGTPPARRQDLVDAFQNDPDPAPLFILSVKAAGTGLNLTRAEHVVHYDRPWNPAVEDQATDRAHRIGQRRTVQVHHLITEGTVEDHIAELLARKRALTDAVLTAGEGALADLDDTELAALVTLGTR